jgi:hypothetical protein
MGLTKNEAELKQLAVEFKAVLTKVQASVKDGLAVARKHGDALEKLVQDVMKKREKLGSEKVEEVKGAQAKKMGEDDAFTLDIMQQLDFYVGGVLAAFKTMEHILEDNESNWAKDLQQAASAFEKAAEVEKDLRKQKWASTFKPAKANDKIRWGNKRGTIQKVEDRPWGRQVTIKFDDGQTLSWPEHMLAGGDFKFYE